MSLTQIIRGNLPNSIDDHYTDIMLENIKLGQALSTIIPIGQKYEGDPTCLSYPLKTSMFNEAQVAKDAASELRALQVVCEDPEMAASEAITPDDYQSVRKLLSIASELSTQKFTPVGISISVSGGVIYKCQLNPLANKVQAAIKRLKSKKEPSLEVIPGVIFKGFSSEGVAFTDMGLVFVPNSNDIQLLEENLGKEIKVTLDVNKRHVRVYVPALDSIESVEVPATETDQDE